jgi:hypothetical protein
MGSGKNTVTSQYKAVSGTAQRALERMVMKLDKIIEQS